MIAPATAVGINPRLNRSKRFSKDQVPYSQKALTQDLLRVRNAWIECQAHRERDAISGFLTAVFDLVMWWKAQDREISRAHWALKLKRLDVLHAHEPFGAIILATAARQKVHKRTRSKWSRVLRYAAGYKTSAEPLATFVQRRGGINKCAARFTRSRGRYRKSV
jgi:hypothetical protein